MPARVSMISMPVGLGVTLTSTISRTPSPLLVTRHSMYRLRNQRWPSAKTMSPVGVNAKPYRAKSGPTADTGSRAGSDTVEPSPGTSTGPPYATRNKGPAGTPPHTALAPASDRHGDSREGAGCRKQELERPRSSWIPELEHAPIALDEGQLERRHGGHERARGVVRPAVDGSIPDRGNRQHAAPGHRLDGHRKHIAAAPAGALRVFRGRDHEGGRRGVHGRCDRARAREEHTRSSSRHAPPPRKVTQPSTVG